MLNQRIADETGRLAAVMAVRDPSTVEIAKVLRALLASSTIGDGIGPHIAVWTDGRELSDDLTAFYAAIGATARNALIRRFATKLPTRQPASNCSPSSANWSPSTRRRARWPPRRTSTCRSWSSPARAIRRHRRHRSPGPPPRPYRVGA